MSRSLAKTLCVTEVAGSPLGHWALGVQLVLVVLTLTMSLGTSSLAGDDFRQLPDGVLMLDDRYYISSTEKQRELLDDAFSRCTQKLMTTPLPEGNGSICFRTWDNVACWTDAQPGEVLVQPCPEYISGLLVHENVTRTCTANGTWLGHPETGLTGWSDYTLCSNTSRVNAPSEMFQIHVPIITILYNIGYGISLSALVVAVVIVLSFKKLYCPRNILHLNLFLSFILRALMSFLRENLFINGIGLAKDLSSDGTFLDIHAAYYTHWECKTVTFVFVYTLSANYIWILMEGLYLYTLIFVAVFSENSSIRWYIVFGWLSPLSFLIPWAIVRATHDNVYCWNLKHRPEFEWIVRGPLLLVILINFAFFLNIIRVLFTKLRASNTREGRRYRYIKLAKSTLVLIPLFGIHYLVMFYLVPDRVSSTVEVVKLYFEMILNSTQGFLVALLYCFLNGEVQSEFKKKWHRFQLQRFPRSRDNISCSNKTANGMTIMESTRVPAPIMVTGKDGSAMRVNGSATEQDTPTRNSSGRSRPFGEESGRLLLEGNDDCFVSESGFTEVMCIESVVK